MKMKDLAFLASPFMSLAIALVNWAVIPGDLVALLIAYAVIGIVAVTLPWPHRIWGNSDTDVQRARFVKLVRRWYFAVLAIIVMMPLFCAVHATAITLAPDAIDSTVQRAAADADIQLALAHDAVVVPFQKPAPSPTAVFYVAVMKPQGLSLVPGSKFVKALGRSILHDPHETAVVTLLLVSLCLGGLYTAEVIGDGALHFAKA